MALAYFHAPHAIFTDLMYLTIWGRYFTLVTFLVGSLVIPQNSFSKYNPFKAWKWYTFMFQLAFLLEWIISPMYWLLLNNKDSYRPDDMFYNILKGGDHVLPLLLLLVDFSMNTIPFCNRHYLLVCVVLLVYMMFNYLVTFIRNKPVYSILDWNSVIGWSLPPASFVYMTFVFGVVKWISNKKLKKNGYEVLFGADSID